MDEFTLGYEVEGVGLLCQHIDPRNPCISHILIGELVEPISQGWIGFMWGEAFVLNSGNIKVMLGTIFSYHAPIILRTFGQLKMAKASIRFRNPKK